MMEPIHLDSASEEQLISIPGIGGVSAKSIIKFLKVHKTVTTLDQLLSCAPQVQVDKLHQMHSDGTWTSNIAEFKEASIDDSAAKTEGGAQAPLLSVDNSTPKSEDGAGAVQQTTEAPLRNSDHGTECLTIQEMIGSLTSTIQGFREEQRRANFTYDTRLVTVEGEVSHTSSSLRQLSDQVSEIRLEMKTTSAISSHYKKGGNSVVASVWEGITSAARRHNVDLGAGAWPDKKVSSNLTTDGDARPKSTPDGSQFPAQQEV